MSTLCSKCGEINARPIVDRCTKCGQQPDAGESEAQAAWVALVTLEGVEGQFFLFFVLFFFFFSFFLFFSVVPLVFCLLCLRVFPLLDGTSLVSAAGRRQSMGRPVAYSDSRGTPVNSVTLTSLAGKSAAEESKVRLC